MADVSLLLAFAGGVVSLLSPCVLPMVPVYLSLITGLEVSEVQEGAKKHSFKVARDTALFIAGFSVVFILFGLSATAVGQVVFDNQLLLTRVSGVIVLGMALFIIGSLATKASWLQSEKRFHPDLSRFGPFAAPVAGAAFGFGWTPCIGPVLTAILAVAATRTQVAEGAVLMAVYSAGLGVAFLAAGLLFSRLTAALAWVKRHYTSVMAASAGFLGIFGVLLIFNRLVWLTAQMNRLLDALGLEGLITLG
jgi:cytochrome c-type biogenesis protein